MKRALFFVLALAACQEEVAQTTDPLPLTETAVGHFCQMNLFEHEGPKAQIHLEGLPGAPLFFSQVRDAVVYLRLPEQSHKVLAVWVNDMGAPGATWANPGAANWIDATTAHFVVGSVREGGMGAPEFVPFADATEAKAFSQDHGGNVMRLDDIPDDLVMAPSADAEPAIEDDSFKDRLKALSARTGG